MGTPRIKKINIKVERKCPSESPTDIKKAKMAVIANEIIAFRVLLIGSITEILLKKPITLSHSTKSKPKTN